jgi:hypothetical protein
MVKGMDDLEQDQNFCQSPGMKFYRVKVALSTVRDEEQNTVLYFDKFFSLKSELCQKDTPPPPD